MSWSAWVLGVGTGIPAGVALACWWRSRTAPAPSLPDPDMRRREMRRRNPFTAG